MCVSQPLLEQLSTHGKSLKAQTDGREHVLFQLFLEGSLVRNRQQSFGW